MAKKAKKSTPSKVADLDSVLVMTNTGFSEGVVTYSANAAQRVPIETADRWKVEGKARDPGDPLPTPETKPLGKVVLKVEVGPSCVVAPRAMQSHTDKLKVDSAGS